MESRITGARLLKYRFIIRNPTLTLRLTKIIILYVKIYVKLNKIHNGEVFEDRNIF